KNIGDENTKWQVDRGLDIKIRFKLTDETRETMITTVEVSPKLAGPKPHESTAHLSFDGRETVAYAVTPPRQNELDVDNVVPLNKEA
ncbi:MAG: hypothetical protein CSA76_07290, partial [Spirochaetales bacterium]